MSRPGTIARLLRTAFAVAVLLAVGGALFNFTAVSKPRSHQSARHRSDRETAFFRQGRRVFRFDTFGDQAFWGGVLGLHRAIEGAKRA
jgi:hypothetical protein